MLKFIQNNREITALLAVVLLFVLPGFLDRQYLSVQTLTMVYSSAQILILLAMGATLVMLTRNIDVSVGSITGMCVGQLSVGGRYEWVNFDYYEDGKYMEGQSRNFSNFFPSVSLGSEIGGVQLQLSYAL